jgi:hypothetical protein
MTLQSFFWLWPRFQFFDPICIRQDSSDVGQARRQSFIYIQDNISRIGAQRHMPRAEFEPTILVFERVMTVRALVRAATVIGFKNGYQHKNIDK